MLIGTTSVDARSTCRGSSEARIPHNVLNAKYHEQEAGIIAEAGRRGAITVATNMAGRGTDIVLGGNVDYSRQAAARAASTPSRRRTSTTPHGTSCAPR